MKRFIPKGFKSLLTPDLIMLATATFLLRFGQGLFGGARTNFFVDTLVARGPARDTGIGLDIHRGAVYAPATG